MHLKPFVMIRHSHPCRCCCSACDGGGAVVVAVVVVRVELVVVHVDIDSMIALLVNRHMSSIMSILGIFPL